MPAPKENIGQKPDRLTLPVEGMTCAACVSHVEGALMEVDGVSGVSVNLATEKAVVDIESAGVAVEQLSQAVARAGYKIPTTKTTMRIGGMTCTSCVSHVQNALNAVAGVVEAGVNLATDKATVEVVEMVLTGLVNKRIVQAIMDEGGRILVMGLAYKKNIDDTRESPAVEIMSLLEEKGADIAYSDPHVPVFPRKRDYHFDLTSVPLTADNISDYDCIVIATDHDAFDYDALAYNAKLVVDTRGRMKAGRNVVLA